MISSRLVLLKKIFLLLLSLSITNGAAILSIPILNCETLTSISIDDQSSFVLNRRDGEKKTNFTCYIHLDPFSKSEVQYIVESLQQHLTDRRAHFALGWIIYEQENRGPLLSEDVFAHFAHYYEMGGRDASTLEMLAHQYQNTGKIDEALSCLKSAASEQMIKRAPPHYFLRLLYINSITNETERHKLLAERNYTYTTIPRLAMFASKYLLVTLGIDEVTLATKSTQMIRYLKHTKLSLRECGLDSGNDADLIVYWRVYFDIHKKAGERTMKEYDAYIKQKYLQRTPLLDMPQTTNSLSTPILQTRKVQFESLHAE